MHANGSTYTNIMKSQATFQSHEVMLFLSVISTASASSLISGNGLGLSPISSLIQHIHLPVDIILSSKLESYQPNYKRNNMLPSPRSRFIITPHKQVAADLESLFQRCFESNKINHKELQQDSLYYLDSFFAPTLLDTINTIISHTTFWGITGSLFLVRSV